MSSTKTSSVTSPPLLLSSSLSSVVCHKCSSRYPNRALTIGLDALKDDDRTYENVYPIIGDTTAESEHEDDERDSHLAVMRCFLSSTDCNSWKCTAISKTKMLYGGKILYFVIDNGNSLNVISKCGVKGLNLKKIPYSTAIRVAWVDKTSLTIFEKCEVPL
ncbi:hypothetical protein Cgig2_012677 [Carnegiea gigantea]|uniref:Uncharacterized protein n=1 Tax=Carnegiea gigantea TaxID=171969 RepID=A0A9Q1JZH9_9CARY|nr:hypothetical protein Cgig2_012677 [Carnegiea gigantea]